MRSGMRAPVDSPRNTSGMPRAFATSFMCADLLHVDDARGRAQHREIVRHDRDSAPLDPAEAGDLAVGGRSLAHLGADAGREQARLREAVGIEQKVEPLAGVEMALGAAAGELVRPAHPQRFLPPALVLGDRLLERHRLQPLPDIS